MTSTPSLVLDIAAGSVLDWADIAPRLLASGGNWMTGPVKWTEKAIGRKLAVSIVPYDLDKAKAEIEAEAEKYSDVMSRSQLVATKVKAILEAADATSDVMEVARLLRELRQVASNPYAWGR
jgi:hypothetical protein